MKVCIIGGGHIGTTLACYIKHHDPKKTVCLYTRRPALFARSIKCNDIEGNYSYSVSLDGISDNPCIVSDAQVVFVALPHFAVEKAFSEISHYVSERAYIGVLPGGGGCEFYFQKYFDERKTLFGFQRVPFTAKLVQYGLETNLKSWKKFSVVGTQKRSRIDDVCIAIEDCGLKTRKASNFLEIALTPTNPILHTSRIYDIFGKYDKEHRFPEKQKFYVGWNDGSSRILFAMDAELHHLLDKIEIDTSAIRPLSEHYESMTVQEMTAKINGIATFQSVYAPMVETEEGGYVADLNSRMFIEDFPWGLAVFRSYFDIFGIKAPVMDKLLKWYADYMGLEWYIGDSFCGRDLRMTGVLSNYAIGSKEELYRHYMQ